MGGWGADRQRGSQIDTQADRQTEKQTERFNQTKRCTYKENGQLTLECSLSFLLSREFSYKKKERNKRHK